MSIVTDIIRTYRAPREVQARRLFGPERDDRALACLLAACALIFVSQWPRLAREAALDNSIALDARLSGALFAWLMVMPLVFYVLALVLGLGVRALGRPMSGFQARMALFWALLASTPVWLLSGLLAGFAPGPGFAIVSTIALGLVVLFTGAGISAISSGKESTA